VIGNWKVAGMGVSTVQSYPILEITPSTQQLITLRLVNDRIPVLAKMSAQISKRRKFVADGVFRAELNDFFTRELSEEGYSGCDVRVTHARTEVSPGLKGCWGG